MSLQMALCETQLTYKTWESEGVPLQKILQIRCSEIAFSSNFDILAA